MLFLRKLHVIYLLKKIDRNFGGFRIDAAIYQVKNGIFSEMIANTVTSRIWPQSSKPA